MKQLDEVLHQKVTASWAKATQKLMLLTKMRGIPEELAAARSASEDAPKDSEPAAPERFKSNKAAKDGQATKETGDNDAPEDIETPAMLMPRRLKTTA